MKKLWIIGYFTIVLAALGVVAYKTIQIDPYFHYHAPNTDDYFYTIDNERSQNDGIVKHFEYDGLITGTSMTENFRASEASELFGGKCVKVPFSGGSYYETNLCLAAAAKNNPNLKYIIRGLDYSFFLDDKDRLRTDLGRYPTYLYDDNWLNDVEYIFNRDVFFSRVYPMTKENDGTDFRGGITSFDDYANWMKRYTFGHKTIFPDGLSVEEPEKLSALSQKDTEKILANIRQNVTSLPEQYPDITFYYFFTPYSAAWWRYKVNTGQLDILIDAERVVIEELLKYDNIQIYSLNCRFDIITDLNNYKDVSHYGEWINSLILHCMHDGRYRLTSDNYLSYLDEERQFYQNYDYTRLIKQEDYENDEYAAALINREITGAEPYEVLDHSDSIEMSNAVIEADQYDGHDGIVCTGRLSRPSGSETAVGEYIRDEAYVGAKIQIPDASPYHYLVFYGKKTADNGQIAVRMYDQSGGEAAALDVSDRDLDEGWHQYLLDISGAEGPCTLILNGGGTDSTASPESGFVFSKITLY